jgi:hypothetical protein
MPQIRLLTSIAGTGPVTGDAGDLLDVDASTADVWADGERAELVAVPIPVEPRRRVTRRGAVEVVDAVDRP